MKNCPECGEELNEGAEICEHCGASLSRAPSQGQGVDRSVRAKQSGSQGTSNMMIVAVIAVIAIILLAAVTSYFVFFQDEEDQQDVQSTPKSAFKEYVELDLSVEDYDIKETTYKEDLSSEDKSEIEDLVRSIEDELNVSVEETCVIKVDLTRASRDEEITDMSMPMVKVDSKWYPTEYMKLPSDKKVTHALSGAIDQRSDGWLVEIAAGTVDWDEDSIQLYNSDTGSAETYTNYDHNPDTGDANLTFENIGEGDENVWVVWNDNDANGEITGGDSFRIEVEGGDTSVISNYWEFRIVDTYLQLDLE